ncbi:hypothetical protein [Haloarcula sp. K1]|uniref:hypothetical protein n=1 Tax=Haloarcula sp. K1 TaxID=1622207 RepID=UPI0007BBA1A9|nr:hypothetical protein [Haloarcula sp. K1]KZX49288.1 hypothetical protein AV929_12145 [Haloarcula sp. K1]
MSSDAADIDLSRYTDGRDRYVNFAEEVLDIRLTEQQRRLLRALAEHRRVIIMSGNGPGKSFGIAIAKVAFLVTNLNSTVLGTSGSYSQYVDAVWRPMKQLHAQLNARLPVDLGTPNDGGQPTLEIEDDWFAKVVSPRDPGDLEGRHAESMLVIIEEADKAYITEEHFDSAGSSITDGNDRMVAICNPPEDEANPVYQRLESDRWHTIQFSSLEAHNVMVDAGEIDAEKIPGVVGLEMVREDWEAWNDEPWPGLEEARRVSDPDSEDFREDLDARWYRRRAGVVPPAGARAHRPFTKSDVEAAWEREPEYYPAQPEAWSVDVARAGGDETVAGAVFGDMLELPYRSQGTEHVEQAERITQTFESYDDGPAAVDAVGEGSGLADMLAARFPEVIRFNAGGEPSDTKSFYDAWAEGLHLLGKWLQEGGCIDDRKLYEELLVAARTLEFEERHLASRGHSGSKVLKLTSKSELKKQLGHSPDRLDAAYMAVWARDAEAGVPSATASLGGDNDDARNEFKNSEIGQAVAEFQERNRKGFRR